MKLSERTKARLAFESAIVLFVVFLAVLYWRTHPDDPVIAGKRLEAREEIIVAATIAPVPVVTEPQPSADAVLLAKIMQAEDGIDWPDWAIMAIGEVVLNRVAAVEFPDTIEAVLLADKPIQYAPVHTDAWKRMDAEARYIELAERLLAGERVLNNPQVVYQALFEQGSDTVLAYTDLSLGSTTYFCTTYNPSLY